MSNHSRQRQQLKRATPLFHRHKPRETPAPSNHKQSSDPAHALHRKSLILKTKQGNRTLSDALAHKHQTNRFILSIQFFITALSTGSMDRFDSYAQILATHSERDALSTK
ncbi:MAG: hypothetical protein COA42_06615 [Alteromonadaceae bacterium]|nr:MAG: hypothetical protein COA42_06615 [Alteromonadaceae bacterium]